MYYIIQEKIKLISVKDFIPTGSVTTAVVNTSEWESIKTALNLEYDIPIDFSNIHFTKMEVYGDSTAGTFCIPDKTNVIAKSHKFGFCIKGKTVIFIDDSNYIEPFMQHLLETKKYKKPSLDRFLYDVFSLIIENDLVYLEEFESKITNVEDTALGGELKNFNRKMSFLRKELLSFHIYYDQLLEVCHQLQENENGFFENTNLHLFRLLSERVKRLHDNSQMLREYSMQVREVYQAQVDIKQNEIMKILTVVTTIFLPLSLIAGWYGMNFPNMPELTWRYGYPIVIFVSILIVIICIKIFKDNDFL